MPKNSDAYDQAGLHDEPLGLLHVNTILLPHFLPLGRDPRTSSSMSMRAPTIHMSSGILHVVFSRTGGTIGRWGLVVLKEICCGQDVVRRIVQDNLDQQEMENDYHSWWLA